MEHELCCRVCGHVTRAPLGELCPTDGRGLVLAADLEAFGDDPTLGETIGGKLLVVGVLGRGAFADVYRGFDVKLRRQVALKVMRYARFPRQHWEEIRRRFFREAKVIAQLPPAVTATVYEWDEVPKSLLYMAMEVIEGRSLERVLAEAKRLTPARTIQIGLGVLDALSVAHDRGIVHRDLKPDNAMLVESLDRFGNHTGHPVESIKVLDFGVAKVLEPALAVLATLQTSQEGLMAGTPLYMAPEQAQGEVPDHRADLYALGVMLYEMLSGEPPFTGTNTLSVLRGHVDRPPPPLSCADEVPQALIDVVFRALAKRPEDRFASAQEMADTLRAIAADITSPASSAAPLPGSVPARRSTRLRSSTLRGPSRSVAGRAIDWLRGDRRWALAAAAVILAVAAAGVAKLVTVDSTVVAAPGHRAAGAQASAGDRKLPTLTPEERLAYAVRLARLEMEPASASALLAALASAPDQNRMEALRAIARLDPALTGVLSHPIVAPWIQGHD